MKFRAILLVIIGLTLILNCGSCNKKPEPGNPVGIIINDKTTKPPNNSAAHKTTPEDNDENGNYKRSTSKIEIRTYYSSFSMIPRGFNTAGHILYKKNSLLFALLQGVYKDMTLMYRNHYAGDLVEMNALVMVKDWVRVENRIGYTRLCKIILFLLSFDRYKEAFEFTKALQNNDVAFLPEYNILTKYRVSTILKELKKIVAKLSKQVKESKPV